MLRAKNDKAILYTFPSLKKGAINTRRGDLPMKRTLSSFLLPVIAVAVSVERAVNYILRTFVPNKVRITVLLTCFHELFCLACWLTNFCSPRLKPDS